MIALPEYRFDAECLGGMSARFLDVGEGGGPVDFRLAQTEQVEVRSIEDEYAWLHHLVLADRTSVPDNRAWGQVQSAHVRSWAARAKAYNSVVPQRNQTSLN